MGFTLPGVRNHLFLLIFYPSEPHSYFAAGFVNSSSVKKAFSSA